ncbi:MAG TPA: APC family permease [Solirubrobacteraceae bacterium]|nr:APC family permease [Solirubrobacteraceae bacterium]
MANVATTPTTPGTPQVNLDEGLDRGIGFIGLLWSSETSIIGSGWLFTALTAVVLAGPSAIIGWVLGSIIILLLALVHAELGGLFPVSGGTSRFPHYAFGSFAGATFGWASYLQAASVAPIEVLAAVQYLSTAHWARNFFKASAAAGSASGTLHGWGYLAAAILLLFFVIVNIVGIRYFARINNGITTWKVAIPVITVLILLIGHFHGSNFGKAAGGFFTPHDAFKNILLTLPAGIIFSLLGFEQAVQLGGESKNPGRDLPRAVILSIIIGAIVYLLVQIAFIGAMPPAVLAHNGGWLGIGKSTQPVPTLLAKGPFFTLASIVGLSWLATVLRIDAVISPSGTGLMYETASARLSYGLSRNGFVPSSFERVNAAKVPVFGVIIATLVGVLFLLPFPSWAKLVGIVTSASVFMYAGAPVSLGALRKQKPDLPRTYRLPAAGFLAPLAFIGAGWVILFSGWQTYSTLVVALLLGYALIGLSYATKLNPRNPAMDWRAAWWIGGWIIGMGVICYISPFGGGGIIGGIGFFKNWLNQGGNDPANLGSASSIWPVIWSILISAAFSLAVYLWAISMRLPEEKVDEYVKDVYPPPTAEH